MENNNKRKANEAINSFNKKLCTESAKEILNQISKPDSEAAAVIPIVEPPVEISAESNENPEVTVDSESGLESRINQISDRRKKATANLHAAADKMAVQHIRKLGKAKVGDTVQIELSKFDRGPLDCAYLLAYITEVDKNRSLYKLCTTKGIIKGWLARNAFAICKQNLVKFDSLDFSKELSLRGINDLESLSGGQGIVACSCQGACKNCTCKTKKMFHAIRNAIKGKKI